MPQCSACNQEKAREEFSKAQLKKSATVRRCKDCSQQEEVLTASTSSNTPAAPSATSRSLVLLLIDEVFPHLYQRGIPPDVAGIISSAVTNDKNSQSNNGQTGGIRAVPPDDLRRRLNQVLHPDSVAWLAIPLLEGLIYAGDLINRRIFIPGSNEPFPLLHCVCQFKLLKRQFQYKGGNDMVALVLRAGALVNDKLSNGCTALFFAVKYGSVETVRLLLEAGADLQATDLYGHTCWKNAVEYGDPQIVELLLDAGLSAADERIEHGREVADREERTLPDFMLNFFISQNTGSPSGDPFSWFLFGPPPADEYATTLVRILQSGASFSENEMALAVCVHSSVPAVERRMNAKKRSLLQYLGKVLFGDRLPSAIAKEVDAYTQEENKRKESLFSQCKICSNQMGQRDNPITLHCGHSFCFNCIKEFQSAAIKSSSNSSYTHKRCPVCKRRVGRDLLTTEQRKVRPQAHVLGIDNGDQADAVPRGPQRLSMKQLSIECRERGLRLPPNASREEMMTELNRDVLTLPSNLLLELSATHTISNETSCYIGPYSGPAVIPITVKTVPVLAWLSPTSPLTVVSKDFVDSFKLEETNLSSKEFVGFTGQGLEKFTALKNFKIHLGPDQISVTLNNAICSYAKSNDKRRPHGVQLGMDFFDSAAWTQCSTYYLGTAAPDEDERPEEDKEEEEEVVTPLLADGCGPVILPGEDQPEELRWHCRSGKTFQTPFIYISNLDDTGDLPVVSLPDTVKFVECEWCGRCFPGSSMKECSGCKALGRVTFYCDENCRKAAAPVHECSAA